MPKAISTAPVTLSSACRTRRPPQHVTGPRDGEAVAARATRASSGRRRGRARASTAKLAAAGANCGRKLVKKTAIFGFERLLSKPWRTPAAASAGRPGPVQARAARPDHASRSAWNAEPGQVERPHELQRGERRLRPAEDGRDPDRGRERPGREAEADAERRRERKPAAAEERVPDDERGVRSRHGDHDRRDEHERDELHRPSLSGTATRHGSSTCCRPSAIRLTPTTSVAMARAANSTVHQYVPLRSSG